MDEKYISDCRRYLGLNSIILEDMINTFDYISDMVDDPDGSKTSYCKDFAEQLDTIRKNNMQAHCAILGFPYIRPQNS